ncbi:xanthine dehydrogenase YagT iron-sulfur-binding subunit [Streptomyces griseochromogenes]|uniref:(2Fe-2S)-binding protein n=1 Tax=Streptomyces griseochromogenes TaxID=68214 RepID=A0A1B1AYE0_9ACTN|nr:2Fe-2S iron-sulfur cluster-binding protein [Streptomyces griseochromogenes]ANP51542.1 (2Fe-2S)-binding protein [Streptomyces griseochromogenes]MBP2049683.1 xanthine dehydrogenase YagT iron-sulfur-binding subunit [Streptomyces griseochromogenes]
MPSSTSSVITLKINGEKYALPVDHRTTLLDALRERLDLTGPKKGCDQGQCGACTVLLDGRRAVACLQLAVAAEGREITTVEGLADGERLHPVQQAFLDLDGFQCGYCTPGQICSAIGVIEEHAAGWPSAVTEDLRPEAGPPPLSADEIRERMSGNLCRCGAYVSIVEAVARAAEAGTLTAPAARISPVAGPKEAVA